MRRSEKSRADSCYAANRIKKNCSRALAVRAGNLHGRKKTLRISERSQKRFCIFQTKFDRECLVTETQEVGKCLLERHFSVLSLWFSVPLWLILAKDN